MAVLRQEDVLLAKNMAECYYHFETPVSQLEVLTAWAILLEDYVGSSDVSFGFGKSSQFTVLTNTVASINLDLGGQQTLNQLVSQIKDQILLHSTHHSTGSTPLRAQVWIFEMEPNIPICGEKSTELQKTAEDGPLFQDIDLSLRCRLLEQGRILCASIASESFSCQQASRTLQQFEHVLRQVCLPKSEDKLICNLDTASPSDVRDIWKWNSTVPETVQKTVLQVFSKHVHYQPDALAVNAWDGSLTYHELHELSNRLSSQLVKVGVCRGVIVPLCFEKSVWTVVAILGVVKAGASFSLLDEDLPQERLMQLVKLVSPNSSLALSSASQRHRANPLVSKLIVVDSSLREMEPLSTPTEPCSDPSDLLYVVFTSGTTGTPKAAKIQHNNVCSFAEILAPMCGVNSSSRILDLASYAYDVSIGNIFLSLLSGACLCTPSSWECKNDVTRTVSSYKVSYAEMTPSVSRSLRTSDLTSLKVLNLGGETCSEAVITKWRGTGIRVMNTYGPAECTVTTVANENVLESMCPCIIGKALGACWVMKITDGECLCPIGGIGELVIEGPLVGDGYLHDQKSTSAAFFKDPVWLIDGCPNLVPGRRGRLYRTGDLVRYHDDGSIIYIGRRDSQVKIRGTRVELGEVAAHLHKHVPAPIQWHPDVVKLQNGVELLVVFVIPPEGAMEYLLSTVTLVDRELRRSLPPAMVPSAYVPIDEIPLSLTGKTDSRRLKQIASTLAPGRLVFPRAGPATNGTGSVGENRLDANGRGANGLNANGHEVNERDANGHEANGFGSNRFEENRCGENRHEESGVNGDGKNWVTENGYGENSHREDGQRENGLGENGSGEKELKLRRLWSEVLNVDSEAIQATSTFFGHGGESLAAIRLVSAAARDGIQLSVATIFRHPQFSDMSEKCSIAVELLQKALGPFALIDKESMREKVLSDVALTCGVSVDNIEDIYPCTPLQQALIAAGFQRDSAYIGRQVLKLPKHVDVSRFVYAWERVATTHLILRTRITDSESLGLLQVVLKEDKLSQPEPVGLADYLRNDRVKRMGLGTPLCRWAIVSELDSKYFILTMHHAIYDGWTLPRIGAEVLKAYEGIRIEPRISFNIFIKHINSLPLQPAREFWERQLVEAGKSFVFPTVPPSVHKPQADSVLSKTFVTPANANRGVSLPSLLRAAWALLMAKLSGSDDVSFGAIVSGRNVPIAGIEDMLSPTTSTVPVRVRLDMDNTVESFVIMVQNEVLEAMPFEVLGLQNIRKLNSDTREGSKFQTLFIVHPPDPDLDPPLGQSPTYQELQILLETMDVSKTLSNFNDYALMILITQQRQELLVEASYDSRVLETSRIRLLLDQFTHVAQQIGQEGNLKCRLRDLSYVSDSDIEAIWTWNATVPKGVQLFVHDAIARTTALQPHAQAICAWDGSTTFEELDTLSSCLAQILASKGICRGSLVPICMEKSMWAAVAMLGIMKTGAGFVAMDIRHQPKQRLRSIVDQVDADWVVTAGPAQNLAQEISRGIIVCDNLYESTNPVEHFAVPTCSPADPAFIVFTSGSTGIPKGIIITHENFCTAIQHHEQPLEITNGSRVYDYASYSFDIAVHNVLTTLALGGCLCVPSEHDRENDIEGSFERLKANWADITPSVARLINPLAVPSLKTLVLSGEAVSKDLILQWSPKVKLVNAYGPAECQICTVQTSLKVPDDAAKIGVGVGCTTWIIDTDGDSLVPIGAIGELVIEGPIVSPGYLNASPLTQKAWIKDPQWLLKGAAGVQGRRGSLYRTGDLARYNSDGAIVYVGRATAQVKINGQRVELEEVEFHMRRSLPGLRDVMADLVDFGGVNQLCAFLLFDGPDKNPKNGSPRNEDDLAIKLMAPPDGLQDRLRDSLPDYMVPAVFIEVSRIPLTTTRKVDRKQLKERAAKLPRNEILNLYQQEESGELELDASERKMQRVWAEVLRLDPVQISRRSDFFQMGGDSILAMRLVKIGRHHGLSYTVSDVFRHSRLNDLVDVASSCTIDNAALRYAFKMIEPFALQLDDDEDLLMASAASACNVPSIDILDIYPCTPFQEGLFALTAKNPSAYVQHTELKIDDRYSLDRVLAAWEAVIASTNILRTRIIQSERAALMQVVIRERPKWRWYESVDNYLVEVARMPMVLGSPLTRFGLIKNASQSQKHSIIWTIHHALYDSWTLEMTLQQVSRSYECQSVEFGPEYNVFVRFLQDQRLESTKWWQSALLGASEATVFPQVPKKSIESPVTSKRQKQFTLPEVLPSGRAVAALLRSAWAIVVARHTRSDLVVFGEAHIGRNIPIKGIDLMRGPTTATVPILIRVDRGQTVGNFLDSVREANIQMQPFEHLGLQNIAQVSDDAKAACSFQTLLVLQESQADPEIGTATKNHIFELDDRIDDIENFNSYAMLIIFTRKNGYLEVEAIFREPVASASLVEFLLHQTQLVFNRLCEAPLSTSLRELDTASVDDLKQIWDWNRTTPEVADRFLHELISEQGQKTPDELAVLAHDGQITYRQLDTFSSNLANQLSSLGIGLNHFVPLCFEKSLWVPVAMLAVLKVGAAFTAMDVSHPESRLRFISDTLGAQLVLTSPAQLDLATRLANQVIVVDRTSCSQTSTSEAHQEHLRQPLPRDTNRIMYVAFTSGSSTGVPKGVMVTHRNLASATMAQAYKLGFRQGSRVFDFSSYSFDATIWHTYWALTTGGCLCTPSQADRMGNLAETMNSFQSTMAFLTPSLARTINPKDVPTMRRLFMGGEAVTPLDVSIWEEYVELVGSYGPTEVTPLQLFTDLKIPEKASTIGRGLGVVPWVVNPEDHNQLMAVGAIGEMVLEGPLVTPGYYQDPERTAAAFVNSPGFLIRGQEDGAGRSGTVYKTGDLVRYSFDGTIEYIGRADFQLKLRGQRLDLGEIEYHLKLAMPQIAAVVCEVITHKLGRQMLAAFCKPGLTPGALEFSGARKHLSEKLPHYMIPEAFFLIQEVPTTPAGKLNRRELRRIGPELLQQSIAKEGVATSEDLYGPLTESETLLQKLWATALGQDAMSFNQDSNFLDVGGDSISAMKLSALARKHGTELTVGRVLMKPQLSAMALIIKPIHSSPSSQAPFSLLKTSDPDQVRARAAAICGVSLDLIEDIYPCTPLQIELFALTMKQPRAYMRRSIFEVPEHVDFQKLIKSWDTVIQLNEILRTRIVDLEGLGLQQVVVRGHHWDSCSNLQVYLAEKQAQADLGTPLAQWAAIHEGNVPKIVWTIHHALYDGWSVQIIEDQLRKAYRNQSLLRPPAFNHFVNYLNSQDFDVATQFWRSRLAGAESSSLYPSLPSKTYQVHPIETFRRTLRPNARSGVNFQAIIHASWALIISRLTGSEDVIFGATLTGRNGPVNGLEQMVGPTITPIPIRIQMNRRQQLVGQLLENIQRDIADMAPFQHIGMKGVSLIDSDTRAACKFQTLIAVMPPDTDINAQEAIRTASYDVAIDGADAFYTFALVLFFTPSGDGIDLEMVFDPAVLDAREIERLSGRMESVISELIQSHSTTRLADVECLGKHDLEDIWKWNSVVPQASERCLHDLILESAQKRPKEIAIDAWDCEISYSQLIELSSNLYNQLRRYGIGRGSVIPILSQKSGFVPVAALAVLRTGAAFLPLDASQPVRRLQASVGQVCPKVVLATESSAKIARSVPAVVVFIDSINIERMAESDYVGVHAKAQPDDVACMLFTSGSTGVPKGVLQTHRALSSAIMHQASLSGFHEGTRAFEFASYSFDVSWNTILKVLSVGGCLCVPSEDERQNDLVGALNRFAATHTELTPSVARLLEPSQLLTLETLIMSGEPVDLRDFQHWRPKFRIIVCYGPSECTSASTINPGLEDASIVDGIGRGVGTVTWIVDPQDHNHLMPVGAVGELLIEGPLVGRGYHNNGEQTQASYVSELPWLRSGLDGKSGRSNTMYKTKDLVRYDSNGNVHFVSRKDTQVKLRGQRIELEEVQHHLAKMMDGLTGSVIATVMTAPNGGSEQILVAFLGSGSTTTSVSDLVSPTPAAVTRLEKLNGSLQDILPSYMIPAAYFFVSTIPRTNNGKADRKKLAEIATSARPGQIYRGRSERRAVRRDPSTAAEAKMQQFWAVSLGIQPENIGSDDNFFSHNGDSITAMRLVALARSQGFDLRVSDVFKTPTLSDLAAKLDTKPCKSEPTEIPPFQLLGSLVDSSMVRSEAALKCSILDLTAVEDAYPCTPLQEGMLAATMKYSGAFVNMRLYRIPKEVDLIRLQSAWAAVITHNRILRTRIVDLKSYGFTQVVINEDNVWENYSNVQEWLEQAQEGNIGLGSRLARWALIDSPQERLLGWTIHHAVYDGWILPMIEDQLKQFYFGQALSSSYPDMRPFLKHILNEDKEPSVKFWTQELEGAEDSTIFPILPTNSYEPRAQCFLEKALPVRSNSSSTGFSLSELLYASWPILVSRITGSKDVVFGALTTGRNAPVDGIEKIMGPTITTVPIRVRVDASQPAGEFMARLRDITVQMMPHEHLGVHSIRRINTASAAACNFQTVLVIQSSVQIHNSHGQHHDQVLMEELNEMEIEGFPDQTAALNQYALMIEIVPIEDSLTVRASFDSNIISMAQMERIVSQWEKILDQLSQVATETPSVSLGIIDSLCQWDLDTLWKWNRDLPLAVHKYVHDMISEVALQHPDAPAIDAWDGHLNYAELERVSSRLSNQLLSHGVEVGSFVPLLFEKSMWANISMLAVLKSGAIFVPLDAEHPEGRLRAAMQLLNAKVILCSAQTRDQAARLVRQAVIVDESVNWDFFETPVNGTAVSSQRTVRREDLAYSVFTSGSTGTPKGVQISHINLATAIRHQSENLGFNSKTRSLDSSSYAFDACVFNFFYTLAQGGCLCVPSDDSLKGDIGAFMSQYRVNLAQLIPSVARTLVPACLKELRCLILTGEALTQGDIEMWATHLRLVNVYGPTECTIMASASQQISESSKAGNIGRGLGANLWLTELGDPSRLAPIGAVGEIMVEGPIIGAGYLGYIEGDKQPLIVDPPWLLAGTKDHPGRHGVLFRTGDQARITDDGTLVFIGRIGSEIKLRGQRVDFADVEDNIRRLMPQEMEVAAEIVHINWGGSGSGRQILLSFISSGSRTTSVDPKERLQQLASGLSAGLDKVLPSYLKPEAIVALQIMPKTTSGKTDRRRLKEMGKQILADHLIWISGNTVGKAKTPPASPMEKMLTEIWAEVLGIKAASIGCEDIFFRLGGDSLGVMRLTTLAHERGILIKAKDVFQTPQLASLAQKIAPLDAIPSSIEAYKSFSLATGISNIEAFIVDYVAPVLGIPSGDVTDIIPANGFQVDYMKSAEEPLGLQYAYLDIGPEICWQKLVQASKAAVESFECLRARFVQHQGNYYQIILRHAPVVTEEVTTTEQVTSFSNKFCAEDCRRAVVSDIFTKLTLVDSGRNVRRVIFRISHMQHDGWCQESIFKAISTAYNDSRIPNTPPFSHLLHYRKRTAEDSIKYWRSTLEGTTQTTPSLILKPGGLQVRTLRTCSLPYFHDATDNRRTRPTVVINVAWALVLADLLGHTDIVFGNVTTGRNGDMPGLSEVVGPCVNMLPTRLRVGKSGNRKQLLSGLVEASAQQVDERISFEGLDWDHVVDNCTVWPRGNRYRSAVHFRNMSFEPKLSFATDDPKNSVKITVGWNELVATPLWTTILVYPEDDVLRLWVLADPKEVGDEGADEILKRIAESVEEILSALKEP